MYLVKTLSASIMEKAISLILKYTSCFYRST